MTILRQQQHRELIRRRRRLSDRRNRFGGVMIWWRRGRCHRWRRVMTITIHLILMLIVLRDHPILQHSTSTVRFFPVLHSKPTKTYYFSNCLWIPIVVPLLRLYFVCKNRYSSLACYSFPEVYIIFFMDWVVIG